MALQELSSAAALATAISAGAIFVEAVVNGDGSVGYVVDTGDTQPSASDPLDTTILGVEAAETAAVDGL